MDRREFLKLSGLTFGATLLYSCLKGGDEVLQIETPIPTSIVLTPVPTKIPIPETSPRPEEEKSVGITITNNWDYGITFSYVVFYRIANEFKLPYPKKSVDINITGETTSYQEDGEIKYHQIVINEGGEKDEIKIAAGNFVEEVIDFKGLPPSTQEDWLFLSIVLSRTIFESLTDLAYQKGEITKNERGALISNYRDALVSDFGFENFMFLLVVPQFQFPGDSSSA